MQIYVRPCTLHPWNNEFIVKKNFLHFWKLVGHLVYNWDSCQAIFVKLSAYHFAVSPYQVWETHSQPWIKSTMKDEWVSLIQRILFNLLSWLTKAIIIEGEVSGNGLIKTKTLVHQSKPSSQNSFHINDYTEPVC